MTASLPLMKSVLTPLAKNLLMPVTAMSLTNTTIQKKKKKDSWIRNYSINNVKWRNERHNENI